MIRLDIFPTTDKEVQYKNLDGVEVSKLVKQYGTDSVVIIPAGNVVAYIHYREIITQNSDGDLILSGSLPDVSDYD